MDKFLKDLFVKCVAASFIAPRKLRYLIYMFLDVKLKQNGLILVVFFITTTFQ
jgi:hypothetical protein